MYRKYPVLAVLYAPPKVASAWAPGKAWKAKRCRKATVRRIASLADEDKATAALIKRNCRNCGGCWLAGT